MMPTTCTEKRMHLFKGRRLSRVEIALTLHRILLLFIAITGSIISSLSVAQSATTPNIAETASLQPDWQAINKRYADLSNQYFKALTKSPANKIKRIKNIEKLFKKVNAQKEQLPLLATATIIHNLDTIKEEIDSKEALFFLQYLLERNIYPAAKEIAREAIEYGSPFTQSKTHYQLSLYFFDQGNVKKTIKNLTAIDIQDALTKREQEYATLIFAISLQRDKKHREAMAIYSKIEKTSYYYGYAKLNEAIALLRQGWWTDGQLAIEAALSSDIPKELRELANRMILVLGYSQLQNEFYRNARNTFRKIDLESQYVNKALMGIGLCALNQKDYFGAINAFSRLQDTQADELSVLETYLLIPLTYQRLKDLESASALYTEAIAYYANQKLAQAKILDGINAIQYGDSPSEILAQLMQQQPLPDIVKSNFSHLLSFDLAHTSGTLRTDLIDLRIEFEKSIASLIEQATHQKIEYIQSYESQSQYGLAKLYDRNQK